MQRKKKIYAWADLDPPPPPPLLKNGQSHDAKNNRSGHLFLIERIPFNLHCRFNECGIRLLILINNYRLFAVYKTRHFLDFLIYYWGQKTNT